MWLLHQERSIQDFDKSPYKPIERYTYEQRHLMKIKIITISIENYFELKGESYPFLSFHSCLSEHSFFVLVFMVITSTATMQKVQRTNQIKKAVNIGTVCSCHKGIKIITKYLHT